jgi:hypothetical protein
MDPDQADGENLGIVKFGPEGAATLVRIMDRLVGAGRLRDWAPRAFDEFAQVRPLHAIGTRGFPWIEIDFPDDYQRAVSTVLPAIEADGVLARRRTRMAEAATTMSDEIELPALPVVAPAADAVHGPAMGAGHLR